VAIITENNIMQGESEVFPMGKKVHQLKILD
jgi:hypothetical protein